MSARIIDGKAIAAGIRATVAERARGLRGQRGIVPGLAFILVGENPASQVYVRSKGKSCEEAGFFSITQRMAATTSREELLATIRTFNEDSRIHGILVQLPLPAHIDEEEVIETIDHRKDVDGFHPVNVGKLVLGQPCLRPCTPAGVMELLAHSDVDPSGKHVVIVGRSNIVGKPLANMLVQKKAGANAVVTVSHTGAKDITPYVRDADILIAAVGRPGIITGAMIRPGCVVVDVGINRVPDQSRPSGYSIVGDVDFDTASRVAGAITPVPGGVGPMTIAMLMKNTLEAAGGSL